MRSATPGVNRWLAEMPDGEIDAGAVPTAWRSVAARALANADNPDDPSGLAMTRVLSHSGTWIVSHGACLDNGEARRVAVIVEPAHPARILPLLMTAHRLTDREQTSPVVVLQGASTAEIAQDRSISPHTVQQHLKAIFEKTGVHTRRALVITIFFAHCEPRFRDNEHRVANDRPIRGGPATPT